MSSQKGNTGQVVMGQGRKCQKVCDFSDFREKEVMALFELPSKATVMSQKRKQEIQRALELEVVFKSGSSRQKRRVGLGG